MTSETMILVIILAFFILFIMGAMKAFKRNWIAFLIILLLIPPIAFLWAFIELFLTQEEKNSNEPN